MVPPEVLLADATLSTDRHVVELGAGVGLLGLVAAYGCPGARSVTMTDVDAEVLCFLRHNVEANAALAPSKGQPHSRLLATRRSTKLTLGSLL